MIIPLSLLRARASLRSSRSVSDTEIHASLVARGTDRRQKDRLLSVQNEFFKFTGDPPRRRADRVPFDRQNRLGSWGTRMSREGGKGFIAPMVDPIFSSRWTTDSGRHGRWIRVAQRDQE